MFKQVHSGWPKAIRSIRVPRKIIEIFFNFFNLNVASFTKWQKDKSWRLDISSSNQKEAKKCLRQQKNFVNEFEYPPFLSVEPEYISDGV